MLQVLIKINDYVVECHHLHIETQDGYKYKKEKLCIKYEHLVCLDLRWVEILFTFWKREKKKKKTKTLLPNCFLFVWIL